MTVIDSINFSQNKQDYTIKVMADKNGYVVRAFGSNDKPVNNITYRVEYGTDFEFSKKYGDSVKFLIKAAKQDIA